MSPYSVTELMAIYLASTGLPPLGTHRGLTDHLLQRMRIPCLRCNPEDHHQQRMECPNCGRYGAYLSPAAVIRMHQIVAAAYPAVRNEERLALTLEQWRDRRALEHVAAYYFGSDALPSAIGAEPTESARLIASIVWRRGLRSEYWLDLLADGSLVVLWEKLPALSLPNGRPWYEVFAWGECDDDSVPLHRQAQRLLGSGWGRTNPAYAWLGKKGLAKSLLRNPAFTLQSAGVLDGDELQWLFKSAAQARGASPARRAALGGWITKRSVQGPQPPLAIDPSNRHAQRIPGTELSRKPEPIVIATRMESSMASSWTIHLALRRLENDRFRLFNGRWSEYLGETEAYYDQDTQDYDIPAEIKGVRVQLVDDGLILGGRLIWECAADQIEFEDFSSDPVTTWLKANNWDPQAIGKRLREAMCSTESPPSNA